MRHVEEGASNESRETANGGKDEEVWGDGGVGGEEQVTIALVVTQPMLLVKSPEFMIFISSFVVSLDSLEALFWIVREARQFPMSCRCTMLRTIPSA